MKSKVIFHEPLATQNDIDTVKHPMLYSETIMNPVLLPSAQWTECPGTERPGTERPGTERPETECPGGLSAQWTQCPGDRAPRRLSTQETEPQDYFVLTFTSFSHYKSFNFQNLSIL